MQQQYWASTMNCENQLLINTPSTCNLLWWLWWLVRNIWQVSQTMWSMEDDAISVSDVCMSSGGLITMAEMTSNACPVDTLAIEGDRQNRVNSLKFGDTLNGSLTQGLLIHKQGQGLQLPADYDLTCINIPKPSCPKLVCSPLCSSIILSHALG